MEDVKKIIEEKEKISEMEEKVLFPEIHTNKVEFLNTSIEVRPLPIGVSKKIATYTADINKVIQKMAAKQKAGKSLEQTEKDIGNTDIFTVDEMVKIVHVLCTFYKVKDADEKEVSIEYIENNSPVEDLVEFIKTQLNISKDNDFLLKPLSVIIMIVSMETKDMIKMLSSSESMQDSVKSGDVLLNN